MEQHGNLTTFNVENVLRQNILNSEYYRKTCLGLSSWSEVIDEIYYNVSHVEPWMSGNARGPSTAFCLLYRLFQLKLDVEEIRATVDHSDSPYIRAVSPARRPAPPCILLHPGLTGFTAADWRFYLLPLCLGGLPVPPLRVRPQQPVELGGPVCPGLGGEAAGPQQRARPLAAPCPAPLPTKLTKIDLLLCLARCRSLLPARRASRSPWANTCGTCCLTRCELNCACWAGAAYLRMHCCPPAAARRCPPPSHCAQRRRAPGC